MQCVGLIGWKSSDSSLPGWMKGLSPETPIIRVYSGNPRYALVPTPIDSIVLIRAAIAALRNAFVHVVLTTVFQDLSVEFEALPANFFHAAYLPGHSMAAHCDLMVHHGGHGSVMTGLQAGTPAVIGQTITERESNARRLAASGAGEVVIPVTGPDGEKTSDWNEFGAALLRGLREPAYRHAVQRISESMRQYGGAKDAADIVEKFAADSRK